MDDPQGGGIRSETVMRNRGPAFLHLGAKVSSREGARPDSAVADFVTDVIATTGLKPFGLDTTKCFGTIAIKI